VIGDSVEIRYPIPFKTNIIIFIIATLLNAYLLWLASHGVWWVVLLASLGFALFHNTLFSLLHEAVHGVFSPNQKVNNLFGHLTAMMFPTSFTMQAIAHLGHHERNRTDREIYDYYLPHESKAKRNFMLYAGNLFGLYWFCIPLINLLIVIAPRFATSEWFITHPARALGFEPYFEEIAQVSTRRLWLESLLALAFQVALWWMLDLNLFGWLIAHWFFALHWSALQYVDHAWSPRDIINGAWNLRVHPLSARIALNYHYHLNHHRHPLVPWIYLPQLTEKTDANPSFWKIYFSLWGGVRPAPPMVTITKEQDNDITLQKS